MKFLGIVLVVCLLLPANVFAASSYNSSLLSVSEISQELSEIGELLNHQDFESAFIRQERLLQYVSDEQITQDLSYDDFIAIIQNYGWQKASDRKSELIQSRIVVHPEERRKCALVNRLSGYTAPCLMPGSRSDFVDRADYFTRLLMRGNQKNTERYITSLQKKVQSLQDKSDLGNVIAFYINQYPKREKYFSPMVRDLGQQIIVADPYWVNGYFLASQGLEPGSREALKLCDNLLLNYRGDDNRKRDSVDPFIKRMCLK